MALLKQAEINHVSIWANSQVHKRCNPSVKWYVHSLHMVRGLTGDQILEGIIWDIKEY